MPELQDMLDAQRHHQLNLLAKRGVVGVGVGLKDPEKGDNRMSVVAMVDQKKPLAAIREEDLVPPDLEGVLTDVVEVGIFRAQVNSGPKDRWRPTIPGGVSAGHYLVTAGTIGGVVYDRDTNEPFILSNNHVFANSNDAQFGDAILQPGATDEGARPVDTVAELDRYLELSFVDQVTNDPNPLRRPPRATPPDNGDEPTLEPPTVQPPPTTPTPPPSANGCAQLVVSFGRLLTELNTAPTAASAMAQTLPTTYDPSAAFHATAQAVIPTNRVDAALARPLDPTMFDPTVLNIGVPTGITPAQIGMRVQKMGRTTGYTEGSVTIINATIDVAYSTLSGMRTARFTGQIMTTGISQGGDSGALVFAQGSQNVVGLLFAGSGTASIFTPITVVLDRLHVNLLPIAR